jgi:hypothetical protein
MTREKRVPLFLRLPEIYRTKDAEQSPPDQLRAYLALVEDAFGLIHENIEALYHDLFIETCDEWAIPYIGDLLGTSHLSGDAWTLRADVADTIALRRRKGTLGAIELLAYNLTEWGVHCVELRENMVWNQHLNHQRPDDGGPPPYRDSRPGDPNPNRRQQAAIRGGTVTLRDPALLALLNTPFDPFAHTADIKPPSDGSIRYNLPNLAIFLWRLAAYRVRASRPVFKGLTDRRGEIPLPPAGDAKLILRFSINPVDRPYLTAGDEKPREPVRLFNTNLVDITSARTRAGGNLDWSRLTPSISLVDETPGPIPPARLTSGAPSGVPEAYVSIDTYDPAVKDLRKLFLSDVGLQLHLPQNEFPGEAFPAEPGKPSLWKFRGANLCAWEVGLQPPLQEQEVAIDPVIGRLIVGVGSDLRAQALIDNLLLTYTYGAAGPVGAHPISRPNLKGAVQVVNANADPQALFKALLHLKDPGSSPLIVEIRDSLTHKLDLNDFIAEGLAHNADGATALLLSKPLIIRAADNQRPIIELARPLRFRPLKVVGNDAQEQRELNAKMSALSVRLEGLYLTRGNNFPSGLIARAALNSLELINCTLDPGGYKTVQGKRSPDIFTSLDLEGTYGFKLPGEVSTFNQIPEIILRRTISGPLLIDNVYRLDLADSIIDAGQGVEDTQKRFAVSSSTDQANAWGPPALLRGVTLLGHMRVESIEGSGCLWAHALEVMDRQRGCIKFSYFSGEAADKLPQNHGCVRGTEAALRFRSELFGDPAYCQLARSCDERIREEGPDGNEMGAFGFLAEAHKWRNLQIRFREFMPVHVRPLLIPVT